ncbi:MULTISPECIES: OmpA family protein [Burkholderia]|uniref:Outer membrane protein OmpA-like peptidoglycan-associated protein n=1 Tax=Burkholderia pyrrocinia TaxID=60550 RepID=A0A318IGL7_BURPY|nr:MULTISPECIES: OmpA family protein [Burkholderia]PXX23791.1 outer membrane protein OmpA-like peptidoglycan-associated protein [Burkholderia pyrrocinia]SFW87963.1 Outer membrane protein OmpA [Burkholderia sp. NFACC33-1]SFY46100.1 Outer membrane protein OmpA [Burkholderia sp. NFPP32]
MKRINLAQALEQCADDAVLQRIADQMGLPPHVVAHVLRSAGPVLVAALTVRAAHGCEDTQAVFDALMSRDSNARIGSECAHLVETTAGLKDFEHRGHVLATRATDIPVAALSDHIAVRTGVPTQPASVLCSIAAAMLAGLIKHHVLLEQGDVTQLPGLLASQLPSVASGMDDGVATLFGYPNVRALADTIAVRLAAVAADFHSRQVSHRHSDDAPNADTIAAHARADEHHLAAAHPRVPDAPAFEGPAGGATPDEASDAVAGNRPLRTDLGTAPAPGVDAEVTVAQHTKRPDAPDYARFVAGKVYANDVHYAGSMATPAYAAPSHPDAPRQTSRVGRRARLWVPVLILVVAVVALAVWAKRDTWAEVISMLTPATSVASAPRATAQAADASVASGAVTPAAASAAAAAEPAAQAQATDSEALAADTWLVAHTNALGAPAVQALLDSDDQRPAVVDPLLARFGKGHFSASLRAGGKGAAVWLDHLDALLPFIAVPGAELTVERHRVMLGGLAPDNAEGWRQRLQQTLGPAFDVQVFDKAAAVSRATDSFLHAMAALLQADSMCNPGQAAAVLNRQVVDFAAGDDRLPPSATENLSTSAQLMKTCAVRNQALRFTIIAHADRANDGAGLLGLTQRRADAIRNFLVNAGVSAASLVAQGVGEDRPVAGTLTAAGQFANRRVEFMPL